VGSPARSADRHASFARDCGRRDRAQVERPVALRGRSRSRGARTSSSSTSSCSSASASSTASDCCGTRSGGPTNRHRLGDGSASCTISAWTATACPAGVLRMLSHGVGITNEAGQMTLSRSLRRSSPLSSLWCHRRRRATKKPAVPWMCGSVCRNSGRRLWRNCGHSSPSEASTSSPDASTTASDSSPLIVHTE